MGATAIRQASRSELRVELDPTRRAAEQIYANLRAEIIALRLQPGSVLDRAALQSAFGRSSTPIRDALMRLADEGLVDIVPQSATRVSLIDLEMAREAHFLRRAVEIEAVGVLCVAPDKSVVPLLRRLISAQKQSASAADLQAFDDLDREFHRRIYEAAGVPALYMLVRQRSGHIDRIRRLHLPVRGRMQEIVRDHGQIMRAIAAGDAARAQHCMRMHLSHSIAYSPALREEHPSFFR